MDFDSGVGKLPLHSLDVLAIQQSEHEGVQIMQLFLIDL
jgi:hypothetical protein